MILRSKLNEIFDRMDPSYFGLGRVWFLIFYFFIFFFLSKPNHLETNRSKISVMFDLPDHTGHNSPVPNSQNSWTFRKVEWPRSDNLETNQRSYARSDRRFHLVLTNLPRIFRNLGWTSLRLGFRSGYLTRVSQKKNPHQHFWAKLGDTENDLQVKTQWNLRSDGS